jgi:hypothetical protein
MTLSSRSSPPAVQHPTTLLERLGQGWEGWLDIWHVLKPMRFSVFILLVEAPFLLVLQQSRDALLALIEDTPGHPGQALLFILFWFSWAFSSFYWARFMSRLDGGDRRHADARAPAEEFIGGAGIGPAGVRVADVGRE